MLSRPACSIAAENSFGPQVVGCLGGFDFTLFFEETILSILPMSLVLLFLPLRIAHLFKSEHKVYGGLLHNLKLVSRFVNITKISVARRLTNANRTTKVKS